MCGAAPIDIQRVCIILMKRSGSSSHARAMATVVMAQCTSQETTMNKDQVKGRVEEVKGKVKEVTGNVLGNDELELEGKVQKNVGKIQANVGDLKEEIKKSI
jgi:uncharacterized protein YjbJ (UPF0337 family)